MPERVVLGRKGATSMVKVRGSEAAPQARCGRATSW